MWADALTKEMTIPPGHDDVLVLNKMELPNCNINKVRAVDGGIRMENIRNRDLE